MTTITNSKPAYILMEIIISIIILSIVGIALLKINSNQKRLYLIAEKKLNFSRYESLVLNQHSINLHNKDINLYDLIKNKYDLKNNFEIQELKKLKIHYSQKYKSIINIKKDDKNINILIDEIRLSNKDGISKFLTVKQ